MPTTPESEIENPAEQSMAQIPQGFSFDEATHSYLLDGRPLTGVTTILSVIAKPALIQWSANLAAAEAFKTGTVEGLKAAIEAYDKIDTEAARELDKAFPAWKAARTTHTKRKTAAADIGTKAHKWIEEYVKASIFNNHYAIRVAEANDFRAAHGLELLPTAIFEYPKAEKDIKPLTDKFVSWATSNNIIFLESEKRIYSRANWYAGTLDLVFLKDGKKHVGDIKTSSGIYGREYFFQMAGYQICLEEMGEKDFVANTIIRCGKDGSFEVKDSFDLESDKAGFLAALSLYRELNKE
jgi:hypothetical protein